ncbi:hypothetical protein L598_001500000440 [Mesorhizobium sp. J18]|uniref:hypothetical protein n=1 Tax=Mesorhizobium sp. J18 TaxID=935263 RepID=UPI001198E5FA|nr:hypothetical protein [Mesorhizobium sp. J18]TWG99321.1 hypothetical protein L598_001500000440 [Mesorhizobium sp. J18]
MKPVKNMLRHPVLLLALLAGLAPVRAMPLADPKPESLVQPVAVNCYAIGRQIALQRGGELMQATAVNSGGRTMCRVVIRVPGRDGERPRRAEFMVPAN